MDNQSDDYTFFKEKIETNYVDIVKYVARFTNDNWAISDITQSVMEDAWKYIDRLRTYDSVKAGLRIMAKNNFIKYIKNHPKCISFEELPENIPTDKALEEIIITDEVYDELLNLIQTLDEKHKRIIVLHHYYKLSLKEIAEILGSNYNTVMSWHLRAIKRLKEICLESGLSVFPL